MARCPDCGDALHGAVCARCENDARPAAPRRREAGGEDSILGLVREAARSVADLGGSVWRTLWRVVVSPGRLSRDWWEGRREGLVSPVRLVSGLLLLLSGFGALAYRVNASGLDFDIVGQTQWRTYLIVGAVAVVMGFVTPATLPATLRRSHYENLVAGLYEGAFIALIQMLVPFVMLIGALIGRETSLIPVATVVLSIAILPVTFAPLLTLLHLYAHLRSAYGMSRVGAVGRTLLTGLVSLLLFLGLWFQLLANGLVPG
ncbi:DUF3667 domain-containing protein [Caulobacter endophyticus]|uniref:DUF3667 domain-containing protein n=1 Tax=Caulobacter endophyticus TaxID=2172652 RepID=UPI002410663F|nr:DUF3667 domain-containing protein [Caulobacter endophyticus]MDG2529514.1 DUF3667 domain-containing protein [Caulobacter endophyticus]